MNSVIYDIEHDEQVMILCIFNVHCQYTIEWSVHVSKHLCNDFREEKMHLYQIDSGLDMFQ